MYSAKFSSCFSRFVKVIHPCTTRWKFLKWSLASIMVQYFDSKAMFSGHRQASPFFAYPGSYSQHHQSSSNNSSHHQSSQQFQSSTTPSDINCNQMWSHLDQTAVAQWHFAGGAAAAANHYSQCRGLYDDNWGSPTNSSTPYGAPTGPLSYYGRQDDYSTGMEGSPDSTGARHSGGGLNSSDVGVDDPCGASPPGEDRTPPPPSSIPSSTASSIMTPVKPRSRSPYEWISRPSYQHQQQPGEKIRGETT